jgi:hypothetical protein
VHEKTPSSKQPEGAGELGGSKEIAQPLDRVLHEIRVAPLRSTKALQSQVLASAMALNKLVQSPPLRAAQERVLPTQPRVVLVADAVTLSVTAVLHLERVAQWAASADVNAGSETVRLAPVDNCDGHVGNP